MFYYILNILMYIYIIKITIIKTYVSNIQYKNKVIIVLHYIILCVHIHKIKKDINTKQ